MKNTLEGISSRITEEEEWISDLEDRMVEFTAAEQNKEKIMKRNEDSLRDLWDNIKCNSIRIIGALEGEEREKGPEKIFEEIIIENFPNMRKERKWNHIKCSVKATNAEKVWKTKIKTKNMGNK